MASPRRIVLALNLILGLVLAHEHHDDSGPYEQNFLNDEPIDRVLKYHIFFQLFTWGLLFPAGMILGLNKSPFHVPVQSIGCVLVLAGNFMGHHHRGREFHSTAHSHFASYVKYYLILQALLGIFLKLHILENTRTRRIAATTHSVIGKSFPVVAWVQIVFGAIAAQGFCFGGHFGQCLAHFIMGSSFIGYALIMLIMLRMGVSFLRRHSFSQEYLDSWVIMVWGIVNTFTEHDFLESSGYWSHKDMQHVSLGVLWWTGGALGIFLSRNGQRSIVPGLIIAMTGFAMSAHEQSMEFSTTVHRFFGAALMAAGLCRIIEISFLLRDGYDAGGEGLDSANQAGYESVAGTQGEGESPNLPPVPTQTPSASILSFQHAPPYLLVLAGVSFMSATEEQLRWVSDAGMDSTTYADVLMCFAFVIYLVFMMMTELFLRTRRELTSTAPKTSEPPQAPPRWVQLMMSKIPLLNRISLPRSSASAEDSEDYESVPFRNDESIELHPQNGLYQGRNTSVFALRDEDEDRV